MKWGLVLSGGAAHGIANAGVVEVLFAHGCKPDYLAGSSMGAIVAGLVAMGHPPAVLRDLVATIKPWTILKPSEAPLKNGLHGGIFRQALDRYLTPLIGDATIGDCVIPFLCIAGRVKEPIRWEKIFKPGFYAYLQDKIEPFVFPEHTKLMDALMATSAMPVTFSPMKIGDSEFVDLLSFGAIPSRTLREKSHADIVIGTDTNPHVGDADWLKVLPVGWQEFLREGEKSLHDSRQACDLIIQPVFANSPYRFDKAQEFYDAGKQAAEKAMSEVRKLLSSAAGQVD